MKQDNPLEAENITPCSKLALLPFGIFLLIFVGTGIYLIGQGEENAFSKYPATVCILPAILSAIFLGRKKLDQTIEHFIDGAGNSNVVAMCLIFLLAGAFSSVAQTTGGVEATVKFGITVIPSWFLTSGFFIISAFIATAMGTSLGTNAAVAPVALGVAETAGIPLAIMAGAVMSGSMFGDNLSIISDTTIAATRTQGCDMKDKFRENVLIAIPAAVICICIYSFYNGSALLPTHNFISWLKIVPYLMILIMAVLGFNVFFVLVVGILLAGGIGFMSSNDYYIENFS